MSAEYVRRHYGVNYKRGDRVTVDRRPGVIVSFPDQYLGVRFDGEKHTQRCHPKWRVAPEDKPNTCPGSLCTEGCVPWGCKPKSGS